MEIINKENFKEKTKQGVVLVDFFANWCGPCRMMSPILENVQKELGDAVRIYKVDVDQDEDLARGFGVLSIPTLVLFVDGEQKDKHVGLMMQDALTELLQRYI